MKTCSRPVRGHCLPLEEGTSLVGREEGAGQSERLIPLTRYTMTLARIVALLSVLVMLGIGAATADHLHDEDDDPQHDCALCTAESLSQFADTQPASSLYPTAALSLPPRPQGSPLCALYRAHLLARAPPALV